MDTIRVVIVDDQALIREGVAALLAMLPGLEVVGQAAGGREALTLVADLLPDVVLMDVRMPGMNGVAATREIHERFPCIRVIVLTTFDNDEYVFESLKAGACGYLLKNADPDQLAAAIRSVHRGEAVLDPAVTEKVIRRAARVESELAYNERLTPREQQVFKLMAGGNTNAEIAERLCLAEGTVKNYLSQIIGKLGARDRAHAVRLGVEWGLLTDE